MDNQIWSWILSAVGLVGFFFAGRKVWWAWYINIACQALWFIYAIVSEQYGFIVASLAYTFLFTKNAIAWTKEHFLPKWIGVSDFTQVDNIRAKTPAEAAARFVAITGHDPHTLYNTAADDVSK